MRPDRARRLPRLVAPILFGAAVLAASAGCRDAAEPAAPSGLDAAWFSSTVWDDGLALVNVYDGQVLQYGTWRDAQVRDYLVREHHDPVERTKRDRLRPDLVQVLKAHRMLAFETGTYGYRRASTLFFRRADGRLTKALGSGQDGCGLTVQRYDDDPGLLRFDSYWEGEGRGERPLRLGAGDHLEDELPFVLFGSAQGRSIRRFPSLTASSLRGWRGPPPTFSVRRSDRTDAPGVVVSLVDAAGGDAATYVYDADGTLASWRVEGAEAFERRASRRFAYWEKTSPQDGPSIGLGR